MREQWKAMLREDNKFHDAYECWIEEFEQWKTANRGHPDRNAYGKYAFLLLCSPSSPCSDKSKG